MSDPTSDDKQRLEDAKESLRIGLQEQSDEDARKFLKRKTKEHVGTTDLEEGNRRYRVLHEWRYDQSGDSA